MSTPFAAQPDYPRTYHMASWSRGLLIIVGGLAVAGGAGFYLVSAGQSAGFSLSLLLVMVTFVLFGLCLLSAVWRSRVVLTADAIEVHGVFTVRRLARADIGGRRLLRVNYGQTVTQLLPNAAGLKTLKFSSSGMQRDGVLDAWIAALPDLDAKEAADSAAEVAADPELGQTPQERLGRLAGAKKTAYAVNAITMALALWGYVYPRPYGPVLLALAVLPWGAVALVAKSAGLYRIDTRRNDVRPAVAVAIFAPGFVLLLRATMDVGVLDWQRALCYGALTAAVLCWAALLSDPAARARRASALTLVALTCAYGYGAVVLANSALDHAPGDRYRVPVLARHMSGGRSTSYYLTLSPWGPRELPKDVSVPHALYLRAAPGKTVCIHRGPGALGISWYVVTLCG